MADLTQGIANMQNRLNPDVFGAYKTGAEAYATPIKQGQDIAKGQIELNQKAREQEMQIRLQKAIEESYDPATGQPNYDKLAANGHKYGITAQQMDYTIKHLKENWSAIADVARSKQQVDAVAQPKWNEAKTFQTTKDPNDVKKEVVTEQSKVAPAVATTPTATQGTATEASTTTKGVASPTTTPEPAVATPTATSDEGKSIDLGKTNISTFKLPKPETDPFTQTPEPLPPQGTLYQNVSDMQVRNPRATIGGTSGAGGSLNATGVSDYTVPRSGSTEYNPATKKYEFKEYTAEELARNPSLDTFKAAENYFRTRTGDTKGNIDDVARSYLASVRDNAIKSEAVPSPPVYPVSGDPKDIDTYNERLRTWQNDNAKAEGKADKAVQEVKEAVAKGQFDLADKLISAQKSTIKIGGKEYRAYNEKSRDNVASLELTEPMANHLKVELAKFGNSSDWEGLKLLIPQVARIVGQRSNPGSQISEGNIAETNASATAEKVSAMGFSSEAMLAIVAEKLTNPTKDLSDIIKEFASGALKTRSPSGVAEKLRGLITASDESAKRYYKDNLIGWGEKPDDSKQPPPKEGTSEETPILKKGWYDRKPGEKLFESETGKQYKVTDRDALGYPSKAIGRDGNEYSIKDEGNGVTLWADEPTSEPTAPKAPRKGPKAPVKSPKRSSAGM